jgi:hypothetical protein
MKARLLERIRLDRIHIAPRALELSTARAQRHFEHIWAPLAHFASRLQPFPAGLLRFWLGQPGGHVVITHLPSRYHPGEEMLKRQRLRNVAYVRLSDLVEHPLEALVPLGHLLDDLLGSKGEGHDRRCSEGGGANEALREVGVRVMKLFPLGYGFDAAACRDVRTYFARSLALYLHDRRSLNAADPQIERLLSTTLLSDGFWRSHAMQTPGS